MTRMIASVGSSMVGSGTVSTRTSWVPCQVKALIDAALPRCRETDRPDGRENRESDIGDLEELRDADAAIRVAPTAMRIGLLPVQRGVRTPRARRPRGPRGAGRLQRPVDLRSLPPVDRRAGPQPVRLVGDRRDRAGDGPAGRHGRDVPDRPHPSRRCSPRRPRRAPILLEGRFTFGVGSGEALNEHILGDRLAERRRAPGDARGGGRVSCAQLWTGEVTTTAAPTTACSPHASTTCPTSRRR